MDLSFFRLENCYGLLGLFTFLLSLLLLYVELVADFGY
jgi:hypothetical protein